MKVTPIKTHIITPGENLLEILDRYITTLSEKSIVAVTSKIVAVCERSIVKQEEADKDELIEKESQYFLPRKENPYNVSFAIKNNILAVSAGIDESNGNGYFILWPKDPQESANTIREFLCRKFNLKYVGVILTDSKTTSMRWGVTAIAIGYSGFAPLKSYINQPDLFHRPFAFEQMSIIDNVACSAALVMGEGNEQMPLAVVSDVPMVEFVNHNPTTEELRSIQITLEEDLYGSFLKNAPWKKGQQK